MTDKPTAKSDEHPTAEYDRLQAAIDAIHDFAAEPRDLFADAVTFEEDHGVLRIAFYCSRPDIARSPAAVPTLPVARISFPIAVFRWRLKEWLLKYEPAGAGKL